LIVEKGIPGTAAPILAEAEKVEAAVKAAVRDALIDHKRAD
jgi:hypothetical protein